MNWLIAVVCSYLLGSVSSAYFLAKLKGVDLRTGGSGNLGASNATVLLGWRIGVAVAILDGLKGLIPVLVFRTLFPENPNIAVLAGLCAVLGHIFPFYLHFKGGKGFATYMGMTLALDWRLFLGVLVLGAVITVATKYIALATLSVVCAVPAAALYFRPDPVLALMLGAMTGIIFYKHRENLRRMREGTEIPLGTAIKGDKRMKTK